MASVKKITMREYNGTDYDTLYPKTVAEQVDGVYSKDEVLSNSTKSLFGLGSDAVPDDALALIKQLIDSANSNINTKAKIATGSYTGTGTYGGTNPTTLTFGFEPKLVLISQSSSGTNTMVAALIRNQTYSCIMSGTEYGYMNISWGENFVSYYSTNAYYQANYTVTYHYCAIG